jgi:hypothetical protein
LNQPPVRLISFSTPFPYIPKSNVRKLCLKFGTVRHTMVMDLNILCHMSNWNLSKVTFTHRQTILVLTSCASYTKAQKYFLNKCHKIMAKLQYNPTAPFPPNKLVPMSASHQMHDFTQKGLCPTTIRGC